MFSAPQEGQVVTHSPPSRPPPQWRQRSRPSSFREAFALQGEVIFHPTQERSLPMVKQERKEKRISPNRRRRKEEVGFLPEEEKRE